MKKKKGIWIMLAVLVILIGVYFAMKYSNERKEQKEEEESEASVIHVTETSGDGIVLMNLDVGNGEISLEKEEDTWYDTQDHDFPLDQDYPVSMAEAAGNITADRKLENGDALADYGLEEPVYTISYTDSEGSTTTVSFGNMTGDYYYVTVNDAGEVYTVESSVLDSFSCTMEDMAKLDDYPSIGSGNLVREEITQNGETTVYDSEEEDQEEDIAAVAGGLGAVTLSDAADYSVEDADLPGFGLDEESRIKVEVTYTDDGEEKLLTLFIGAEDGEGNRYVMLNDSRIVYLITDGICDNILNI